MKHLTNTELETSLKNLITREIKIDKEIILHLEEVERRRLFLAHDCSSMFAYCRKFLGMTEAQTQRRLTAMRTIKNDPILKSRMEEGDVSMSQLSLIGNIENKLIKSGKTKTEVKKTIHKNLDSIKHQSVKNTEKILYREFAMKSKKKITLEVDIETFELWREFRLKHAKKNDDDFIKDIIQVEEKINNSVIVRKTEQSGRSPSPNLKTAILEKSNYQCEFVNPKTKKRCQGKTNLNIDHIKPWSRGGQTAFTNLQCLCFHHNQQKGNTTIHVSDNRRKLLNRTGAVVT